MHIASQHDYTTRTHLDLVATVAGPTRVAHAEAVNAGGMAGAGRVAHVGHQNGEAALLRRETVGRDRREAQNVAANLRRLGRPLEDARHVVGALQERKSKRGGGDERKAPKRRGLARREEGATICAHDSDPRHGHRGSGGRVHRQAKGSPRTAARPPGCAPSPRWSWRAPESSLTIESKRRGGRGRRGSAAISIGEPEC